MKLRRIFVAWTCVIAVGWFLVWLAVADDSSSCEATRSWICVDSGVVAGAVAVYALGIWLFGVFVVALGVGLARYWRRVMSNYDGA